MQLFTAAQVFDGWQLHQGAAVSVTPEGRIAALHPAGSPWPEGTARVDLGAGVLAPGLVDLQVNGGDGAMVGPETDAAQLARICAAHARLGATAILPTLITDRAEITAQVIDAGREAACQRVPGFAGLHLEGPHLDPARKGAHDPALIRPMTEADLAQLSAAARALPALMVTLAPEAATPAQIAALSAAGAVVSLGHTGCAAAQAQAAEAAGARAVTHLFNAMGGLMNRAPGLVGAALTGRMAAGIIADGVHVAPECLLVAARMKAPDGLFLVSDAMAVAGTTLERITLNGREIQRREGRLTLADGTLAGADVTLPRAVAHMAGLGVDRAAALAMASRVPADLIGAQDRGRIAPGARGDLVHLSDRLELRGVWLGGVAVG